MKKRHTDVDETSNKSFTSNDFIPDLSSRYLDMKMPNQGNLQWRSKNLKRICLDDGSLSSEGMKVNPKELNPYLQDNGSGYPNDALNSAAGSSQLTSSLVGDGGASWRLKALKRAKEQAARHGLTLQEVVGERWGSLQELATSVAGHRSAPAHAHLYAIKERKKGHTDVEETRDKLFNSNDFLPDLSSGCPDMKKPNKENLQWRSKNLKRIRLEDGSLPLEAISYINNFPNDGNFMNCISNQKNQKHMDLLVENLNAPSKAIRQEIRGSNNRFIEKQLPSGRKKYEDDEYDFYEGAPSRKHIKKKNITRQDKINLSNRILTQKEHCHFCFENPSRPKHLVISIGNYTYMMLSFWERVLDGHCCILPLQHELATRIIDKNVWEEIHNFKKCLLKMFSRQDKDVIFLETVIGLSSQRRHCLIDCIPIPSHIAKQAPLYFKKAIDEAEDEWGQHDMKKVIPTSGNLRNVIPENFSYFHVEFGLDRGFVHVIDDDSNFPSSFGLNVVRGMLRLPVETRHHHRRREPDEKLKQAVATFVKEWEPFDWTRELD